MFRDGRAQILALACIMAIAALAYLNSIAVPFVFDDEYAIEKNPIVRNLGYFIHPSEASQHQGYFEYGFFKRRYAGYLTFALNYAAGGLNPRGYHIVNILIHMIGAAGAYVLVLLLFRARDGGGGHMAALVAGLLFAVHPAQTQAVTYVWQRVTSLAGASYALALAAYLGARMAESVSRRNALYALSLALAVVAFKSKETAFTLPFMMLMAEAVFFGRPSLRRLAALAPFLALSALVPLSIMDFSSPVGEALLGATTESPTMSRFQYAYNSCRVLVTYLRLYALPMNLVLDYGYPVSASPLAADIVISVLILVALLLAGVWASLSRRQAWIKVAGFGVLWFFVALSVESSFMPLDNLIHEHRLYLPAYGVFMTAGALFEGLTDRSRAHWWMMMALVALMFAATVNRNMDWRTPLALWQDTVAKAPMNPRALNNLGKFYLDGKNAEAARPVLELAVRLAPRGIEASNNLAGIYLDDGRYDEAIALYQRVRELSPRYSNSYKGLSRAYAAKGMTEEAFRIEREYLALNPSSADSFLEMGGIYFAKGANAEALEMFRRAAELDPASFGAHYNMGQTYRRMGQGELAEQSLHRAVALEPLNPSGYIALAALYLETGRPALAIEVFERAVELMPGQASLAFDLAMLYGPAGRFDEARALLERAVALEPSNAKFHGGLGTAYQAEGMFDKAEAEYGRAIELWPDYYEALFNLGTIYEGSGRMDMARRMYRRAQSARAGVKGVQ